MNRILIIFIVFSLSACQSVIVDKPDPTSKKGGYYSDDGPEKNIPQNLDLIEDAVPKTEPIAKRANMPYKVFGKKYIPMRKIVPFKEKGYASWYGKKYHGNKTSIGEVYDMYQMTAAHKTLPLPCFVKVTNLKNNKTVTVRVNDRGPFIKDRIIDLSYAAAHRLDIIEKGSEEVEIEVIIPTLSKLNKSDDKGFFLQVGAFSKKNNALDLVTKIKAIHAEDKQDIKIIKKSSLYSVVIGPSASKEEAKNLSTLISSTLKQNAFIIKH